MNSVTISSPPGLAIHTATGQLGLALQRGQQRERQRTWLVERQLLNQLHQCLLDFLPLSQWPELAYLAVAQGPGSFTSVRLGMVAARTLAQQLAIPLFAISSLACFAQSLLTPEPQGQFFAVTMPATRGYLYGAIYQIERGKLITLDGDRLWLPSAWEDFLAQKKIEKVYRAPAQLGYTAPQLLTLAHQQWLAGDRPHWSQAQPFYGMGPTDQPPKVSPAAKALG